MATYEAGIQCSECRYMTFMGRCCVQAIKNAIEAARQEAREEAARVCDRMIVGGRAWTHDQQVAAEALAAAAKNIRALTPGGVEAGERDPIAEALHNHGMGQKDGYARALADVEAKARATFPKDNPGLTEMMAVVRIVGLVRKDGDRG